MAVMALLGKAVQCSRAISRSKPAVQPRWSIFSQQRTRQGQHRKKKKHRKKGEKKGRRQVGKGNGARKETKDSLARQRCGADSDGGGEANWKKDKHASCRKERRCPDYLFTFQRLNTKCHAGRKGAALRGSSAAPVPHLGGAQQRSAPAVSK